MSRIDGVDLASASAAEPPFLGALGMDHRTGLPKTFTPPLCWAPWGMENSPGGPVWAGDSFGPVSGTNVRRPLLPLDSESEDEARETLRSG